MQTTEIAVTRTIAALPADVFDAWFDPAHPGGPWYGVARAIVHPVVDGLFYREIVHEGRASSHYGRFVHVDRPTRLEFTWMSEATRGLETHVTMTFEPHPTGTTVILRQTGVPDDDAGRGLEAQWAVLLATMAERFAADAP